MARQIHAWSICSPLIRRSPAPVLSRTTELFYSKHSPRIRTNTNARTYVRTHARTHERIPPVKWRPLADRSCTSDTAWWANHELVLSKFVRLIFLYSGAPWWMGIVLVSPNTDNYRINTVQIRVSYFYKWRPLVDRLCASGAIWWIYSVEVAIRELVLSKFVRLIFLSGAI